MSRPDWYRNYKKQDYAIFTWCARTLKEVALLHHMAFHDLEIGIKTVLSITEQSGSIVEKNREVLLYTLIILTSNNVMSRMEIEQAIKKIPSNNYTSGRKP